MRRWLREPLVQFLLLGLLLFVIHGVVRRVASARDPASNRIALTIDDVRQLEVGFAAQWQRPPTRQERDALVENRIRQEVLYREALALGLDKEDSIVKRRMAQKMEFLAEDTSAAHEPTTAELQDWFQKNSARFALPGRVTFRHLYFSPDRRGVRAREEAKIALGRLAHQTEDSPIVKKVGDPFMFHVYFADLASAEIAKEFGPSFAQAVFALEPGGWKGPIESGYGWHLVFVESSTPSRVPPFAEVESEVRTAWLATQKAEAWDRAYQAMRAKYQLEASASP